MGLGRSTIAENTLAADELRALAQRLRSADPAERRVAAQQIADRGLVSSRVRDALLKAVSAGDFVTREGLARAIERAWSNQVTVEAALREAAMSTTAQDQERVYARAALRAIGERE
jgi:hypothetical protein